MLASPLRISQIRTQESLFEDTPCASYKSHFETFSKCGDRHSYFSVEDDIMGKGEGLKLGEDEPTPQTVSYRSQESCSSPW